MFIAKGCLDQFSSVVRNLRLHWVNPGVKLFIEVLQELKAGNPWGLFKDTYAGNSWQNCSVPMHLSFLQCDTGQKQPKVA